MNSPSSQNDSTNVPNKKQNNREVNGLHEQPDSLPSASTNQADNNANMNNDRSKGAIPKVKPAPKPSSGSKKNVKLNNNIENLQTLNSSNPSCSSYNLTRRNGFSNISLPETTRNPFEECFLTESPLEAKKPCILNIPFQNQFSGHSSKAVDLRKSDSDSSSDDNELLSVSDDGCIYTYKGDNAADLPSSFFNLEMPSLENNDLNENRQGNSSPEMDFLEMDFDPGPSGDADSESNASNSEIDNAAVLPLDPAKESNLENETPPTLVLNEENDVAAAAASAPVKNTHSPPRFLELHQSPSCSVVKKRRTNSMLEEMQMPWSCPVSDRTQSSAVLRTVRRHHSSKGELVSPSEYVLSPSSDPTTTNLTSFHNAIGKILIDEKGTVIYDIEKIMIWNEQEACLKQITQIGPSSCGATAVLNVLNALRFPLPPMDKIQEYVNTRLRANTAPLAQYLQSRGNAGCTHRDIISGLAKASEGRVYARFFSLYPERVVNVYKWLGFWIQQGAVPVATLNLQKCKGSVPDSWHHQMIFGVGPEGVYLSNPLECVAAGQLWPQLTSESVLMVRRQDVVSRWNPKTDLPQIMKISDTRWRDINVLGQVSKIIREERRKNRVGLTCTPHITIPAEYKSGITLAIDMNSPAFSFLQECPELPLLHPYNATTMW